MNTKVQVIIGDWVTWCCDEDLKCIETTDDLRDILEDIEEDVHVPLGVWPTKKEALIWIEAHRPMVMES